MLHFRQCVIHSTCCCGFFFFLLSWVGGPSVWYRTCIHTAKRIWSHVPLNVVWLIRSQTQPQCVLGTPVLTCDKITFYYGSCRRSSFSLSYCLCILCATKWIHSFHNNAVQWHWRHSLIVRMDVDSGSCNLDLSCPVSFKDKCDRVKS